MMVRAGDVIAVEKTVSTIPIPKTSFYAMMRRGHQTGHGHPLRGHLAPHPTTAGVMILVKTCCGQS